MLGHTDASKAQCIDCENCFHSVAINQESKLFTGWMSSGKMPQRYLYSVGYMRKFPSTRTTCKKGETGRGMLLAAHCRADLVTGCEKEKNTNIIRWLSVSFFGRKWMSIFVFGRKWNLIFVCFFVYDRKWKMLFGRPLVHITKKVLVLRCKVLVLKKSWLHHCYLLTFRAIFNGISNAQRFYLVLCHSFIRWCFRAVDWFLR